MRSIKITWHLSGALMSLETGDKCVTDSPVTSPVRLSSTQMVPFNDSTSCGHCNKVTKYRWCAAYKLSFYSLCIDCIVLSACWVQLALQLSKCHAANFKTFTTVTIYNGNNRQITKLADSILVGDTKGVFCEYYLDDIINSIGALIVMT